MCHYLIQVPKSPLLLRKHLFLTKCKHTVSTGGSYMLNCFSPVQLCETPWTVAHLAPLPMRFSRQEYWSGLPFPSPEHLPDQGIALTSLLSPELAGAPPGKSRGTYSSVQLSCSVVSDSLQPHESQKARPSCPSPTPRVYPNSCPSSRWWPSSQLILCCPLLLLPSILPSIRVFSNESTLRIRWPKYWSFSFNISPSNEHSGLISFKMD